MLDGTDKEGGLSARETTVPFMQKTSEASTRFGDLLHTSWMSVQRTRLTSILYDRSFLKSIDNSSGRWPGNDFPSAYSASLRPLYRLRNTNISLQFEKPGEIKITE